MNDPPVTHSASVNKELGCGARAAELTLIGSHLLAAEPCRKTSTGVPVLTHSVLPLSSAVTVRVPRFWAGVAAPPQPLASGVADPAGVAAGDEADEVGSWAADGLGCWPQAAMMKGTPAISVADKSMARIPIRCTDTSPFRCCPSSRHRHDWTSQGWVPVPARMSGQQVQFSARKSRGSSRAMCRRQPSCMSKTSPFHRAER